MKRTLQSSFKLSRIAAGLITCMLATTLSAEPIPDVLDPGYLSVIAGGEDIGNNEPALISPVFYPVIALDVDEKGRVYYRDHTWTIRRVELDGTITLFEGIENVAHFTIAGQYLYYVKNWSVEIFQVNIETGVTQLHGTMVPPEGLDCCQFGHRALAVDSNQNVYFHTFLWLFRVDAQTGETIHFAGNGLEGDLEDGVVATETIINDVIMAIDPTDDSLLIADWQKGNIRRIDPVTGILSNLGPTRPTVLGLDVDPSGKISYSDGVYIRTLASDFSDDEIVAGINLIQFNGDGTPVLETALAPRLIALDPDGNYFVHSLHPESSNRIRHVDLDRDMVRTVAGTNGFLGCASPVETNFIQASAMGLDANGVVYVLSHGAVLAVDEDLDTIFNVAGIYGAFGHTEDGEEAFNNPIFQDGYWEIFTVSPNGDFYFIDRSNFGFPTLRQIDRESGLLKTVAGGSFDDIQHDGDGHIYGLLEVNDWVDFVKVDEVTGEVVTLIAGGDAIPVIGESVEGRIFRNSNANSYYREQESRNLRDTVFDSQGNIYLLLNKAMAPEVPAGVYRVDGQTKVLSAIAVEEPGSTRSTETSITGQLSKMVLDEERGFLYFTALQDFESEEYAGVVRVDIVTGEQVRIAGRNFDSLISEFGTNPLEIGLNPLDIALADNGEVYVLHGGRIYSSQNSYYVLKISSNSPADSSNIPTDIKAGARVGQSVASLESWSAIGVPNSDRARSGKGEVLVYQDNDCRPILRERLQAPEGTTASQFGSQLAFVGDYLVVSSGSESLTDSSSQKFERPSVDSRPSIENESTFQLGVFGLKGGRNWRFEKDLSGQLPPTDSESAGSLVSDNDSFAIGSPAANDGVGEVTLFDIADLDLPISVIPSDAETTEFGKSLAMEEGLLAVGADSGLQGGAVELFERGDSGFVSKGRVSGAEANVNFATDLALNDQALYVGSPHEDGGRVFGFDLSDLGAVESIADPDNPSNPSFGQALAIEDGILVVGAPDTLPAVTRLAKTKSGRESIPQATTGNGVVYAFGVKSSSGRRSAAQRLFTLQALAAKAYGYDVDVSEGRIVVGAPETDEGRGSFDHAGAVVNAADLSGLWYDPSLDGEGFNVLVADAGVVVFFYGYTSGGERFWLISETVSGEFRFGEEIQVPVFKSVEGNFDTPVSSQQALVQYGLLTISFGSLRSATFSINGFDGNKISRTAFLADTSANSARYSGLWYDPSKDGEGYNVISGKPGTVIYYYGSGNDGQRLWLISDVLTNEITDGTTISGKMYEATGGTFDHPEPSSSALKDWGTIEASFNGCSAGEFIVTGTDGSKTSKVVKLAGVAGADCN